MGTTQLRRSTNSRILGGVASGVAAMFEVDPVIIRLAFAALTLLNGTGVMLYLAMWLLVPREDSLAESPNDQMRENMTDVRETAERVVNRIRSYISA